MVITGCCTFFHYSSAPEFSETLQNLEIAGKRTAYKLRKNRPVSLERSINHPYGMTEENPT
jgi:hypothetical protein